MFASIARPLVLGLVTTWAGFAAAGAPSDPSAGAVVGQHPAMAPVAWVRGVDTDHFRVGHPASPTTRAGHANHAHPAVTAAEQAQGGAAPIDANRFLVQPPATTRWTAAPAAGVAAPGLGD